MSPTIGIGQIESSERFVLPQFPVNQKVIDIYSQLAETTFPR